MTKHGLRHIIFLTREPLVSEYLTAGRLGLQKVALHLARTRALLFACNVDCKSYNGANHNYKLNQIRICNHSTSPLSLSVQRLT